MSLCFPAEVVQPPSLYVMVPSEEERFNNTATFVCLARDFSPPKHQFFWKLNGQNVEGKSTCQLQSPEAINYTASSYLVLSDKEWMKGTTITCLFEHKTGTKSKNVIRQTGGEQNKQVQSLRLYLVTVISIIIKIYYIVTEKSSEKSGYLSGFKFSVADFKQFIFIPEASHTRQTVIAMHRWCKHKAID